MKLLQYVPGYHERNRRSMLLLIGAAAGFGLLMLATLVWVMNGIAQDGHARRQALAEQTRMAWMCATPGASLSADCAGASSRTASHHAADQSPLVTVSLRQ